MRDATGRAFGQQHGDDVLGRAVGKELALVFFVKGDAVFLHQRNEVGRCVARQRRAAKLRVLPHKVLVRSSRVQVAVGEVAAPAARDADLLGHLVGVVDEQDFQPALAGLACTEQAGGTGADDDNIKNKGSEGHRGFRQR